MGSVIVSMELSRRPDDTHSFMGPSNVGVPPAVGAKPLDHNLLDDEIQSEVRDRERDRGEAVEQLAVAPQQQRNVLLARVVVIELQHVRPSLGAMGLST